MLLSGCLQVQFRAHECQRRLLCFQGNGQAKRFAFLGLSQACAGVAVEQVSQVQFAFGFSQLTQQGHPFGFGLLPGGCQRMSASVLLGLRRAQGGTHGGRCWH